MVFIVVSIFSIAYVYGSLNALQDRDASHSRFYTIFYYLFRVDDSAELQAPAWMAVLLMVIWISLDAILFMALEKWSFTKSLYFIFITLTTIGFGDIVPENDSVSMISDRFRAVYQNVNTSLCIKICQQTISLN